MGYVERLNGLDLFSGIGGFSLALQRYIKTIAYCENDAHAQSVLLSRMADGSLESAPIWDDITTITGEHFNIPIDIITGGFPCQDISVAGNGRGLDGKRSGLFYEIVRLAEEIKPSFLFLENVPAIRTRGLDRVIEELTEIGYDCRWTMLPAANVGAPHKRERWFILAYARSQRLQRLCSSERTQKKHSEFNCAIVTNAHFMRMERAWAEFQTTRLDKSFTYNGVSIKPHLVRSIHGFPSKLDNLKQSGTEMDSCEKKHRAERIKRLGNSVVPLQALIAFEYLLKGNIKER